MTGSRYVLVSLAFCASSCSLPVTLTVVPGADQTRWEQQITDGVNEHELRLRALEKAVGIPTPIPTEVPHAS